MKSQSLNYKRIVIKAGTAVLTQGEEHSQLNEQNIKNLVEQIISLMNSGYEIVLISSGAIASGRDIIQNNLNNQNKRNIVSRQVLAAIGQSKLMNIYQESFEESGVYTAQTLLTSGDLSNRQSYLNIKNTLISLLQLKAVPILNENDVVAVEEISHVFGDNDRLSALVANLIDADLLIILSDTDGLFNKDPNTFPDAKLVKQVTTIDDSVDRMIGKNINPWARGGMVTKIEAARLVTSAGIPMVLCNGKTPDILLQVVNNDFTGTLFEAKQERLESRKTWMLAIATEFSSAHICVDEGAKQALLKNASLLPSGILKLHGTFDRGDVIYITDESAANPFACGITNYSSDDVSQISGQQSTNIEATLGYNYGEEIIHRDNLVNL